MSTAAQKRSDRVELADDFDVTMRFFNLPKANREIAWDSAQMYPVQSARAYRAIVNSLPKSFLNE